MRQGPLFFLLFFLGIQSLFFILSPSSFAAFLDCQIDLNLRDLSGQRDENHAFEGINLKGLLKFESGWKARGQTEFKIKAGWEDGAIFIYPWFFDLKALRGAFEAEGTYLKDKILLKHLKVHGPFNLRANNMQIFFNGKQINGFSRLLKGEIQIDANLNRWFNILLRDAYSNSHPFLLDLEPSGKINLKVMPKRASLFLTSEVSFRKRPLFEGLILNLSYPLGEDFCENGNIYWKRLDLSPFLPKRLLKEETNIYFKSNKVPISLCKKYLEVGPVVLFLKKEKELLLKKLRLFFEKKGLELEGLHLDELDLKDVFKDFPISIKVSGNIKRAYLKGERVIFEGALKAKVANGKIDIKNLWLDPFSAIPRIGCDILFKHIDLSEITSNTGFGLITGVINGFIKGLIISGSQPEEFFLKILTDETANVPKKISIKAIENISILGGGQGSMSLIGQFFKEFSYKHIGISCKLKNDVFELHGLIKEGGKEYLVKRGFWGGVNVVNMNPDGKISFRDMLERLKRITESDKSKMEVY